jgi:uncharacterized repeat protein (TIGR01451 family)
MGNGRWLEESSKKASGKHLAWVPALGAMFVLLMAGSVLLGLGSRRHTQKAAAAGAVSPAATSARSSLKSEPLQSKPEARAILGQLPLIFEPNQGQADSRAKFLAHGAGYSLFLDENSALLAMQTAHSSRAGHSEQFVRMTLVGANPATALAGADPLPGKSNYFVGNDPKKWHSGVPQFAGVHYASVYPGIDLVFYGNQGHLEYDFRVAPGADPSQAELQFDGATKLELSGGDLILTGKDDGGLRLQAPHIYQHDAYQRDGDHHQPVTGRFVLRAANRVGFEVGPYDHSRELIIDPVLDFSTYFGGSGTETSPSVAVNGDGNIYIVGSTTSPPSSFPLSTLGTTGFTQLGTAPNIFVAKINPSQPPALVYATFIGGSGGSGADTSVGIGVDNGGNVYIAGNTSSTNFPTGGTNGTPYQTGPETKTQCTLSPTCTSAFVSVLNSAGSAFKYSTYLSGDGDDQASGMTIDAQADVFVTGTTTSQDVASSTDVFPATLVTYQSSPKPGSTIQFFATKVDTNLPGPVGIEYSTYFGGATPAGAIATGGGIAVDATGNMYFSGTTNFYNSGSGAFGGSGLSDDFPIVNAYQPCLDTPPPNPLLNPNPCSAPATTPYPTDAFVAKLNPLGSTGTQLLFSTYLGGSGTDTGPAIAIDSGAANIYLTGETNSSDFIFPLGITPFQLCLDTPPTIPPSVPPCPVITATPAPFDAYVARMTNPTQNGSGAPVGVGLTYFSYLGGGGNDSGAAIAVLNSPASTTPLDDVVLTGATSSGVIGVNNPVVDFPVTTGALQSTLNGPQNAFYAQINTATTVNQNGVGSYVTYFGGNGTDRGTGIAVDPSLNSYFVGDTTSTNLEVEDPLQSTLATGATRNAFVVKLGTAADLCITCVAPIISPLGEVSAGNQVTVTFTVANEGPDPATNIAVSGQVPTGMTFNSATASSGTCSAPSGTAVLCQIPALQSGSVSTVAFVATPISACTACSITATVSSSNDTNTSNTAIASFVAGGYSVSIGPTALTVQAGLPAQYAVTVAPTQGVFGANVSLSCSALPTGAVCNFANTTVALNGASSASTVLNLTTTAQPETTVTSAPWRRSLYALWLMVPGMALLGMGAGGKRRGWQVGKKTSRLLGLLALSVLFALVLLQPSCSSGRTQPAVSGTPSGTYPLTITATSGSFTASVPFSLTVIP